MATTTKEKVDVFEVEGAYSRKQSARRVRPGANSLVTTIPKDIADRAAAKSGMDFDEFLKSHEIVFYYGSTEGAFIRFERKIPA
jgi:hypothetical protein